MLTTDGKQDMQKAFTLGKTKSGAIDTTTAQFLCLIFSHSQWDGTDPAGKDPSVSKGLRGAGESKQQRPQGSLTLINK